MGQTIREAFAQWLKGQLRTQGLMVSDFAERVGVRPSAVYRWTAGQRTPTDGQIEKIAEVLQVPSAVIWEELAREGITPMGATNRPNHSADPASQDHTPSSAEPPPPAVPPEERPFAKWLRGELEQRGWTVGYLARHIGLDVVTVRAWASGLRTPASVQFPGLANALGTDVETVARLAQE
jgi:transcriptional regulator with XRE-family HTH domain